MKTQSRRFIVERKFPKRKPGAKSGSLWGDTDLKALALEVEQNVPGMFASAPEPDIAPKVHAEFTPCIDKETTPDVSTAGTGGSEDRSTHPSRASRAIKGAVSLTQNNNNVSDKASRVAPPIAGESAADLQNQAAAESEAKAPSLVDLSKLDLENRRLKALWREHLLAQNTALRALAQRLHGDQQVRTGSNLPGHSPSVATDLLIRT